MELLLTSDLYREADPGPNPVDGVPARGVGSPVPAAATPTSSPVFAALLREVLALSLELRVSDVQFRSDRLLYVETDGGLRILEQYGTLDSETVLGVLRELCVYKEETDPIFLLDDEDCDASSSAFDKIMSHLRRHRVADFSCRAIPLDDMGSVCGRLRVQAHFSNSGLGVTCRILKEYIPGMEELGFAPDTVTALRQHAVRRAGLCLVTGPTGSGKSTTLASLMDWVRRHHRKHIVTIEDPVEYLYPTDIQGPGGTSFPAPGLVTQQEVGRDVASFRQGLKDVLRKAPHVILLGELRDREAVETCMEAAQTGHLVLTTVHTTGAVKTLGRILELFPRDKHESVLSRLSEVLLFILSQGLLRTDQGRVLTYEFLQNADDACASAIANYHRGAGSLNDVIGRQGNIEWDASLLRLLRQGRIDEETFLNNRMRRETDIHV